MTSTIGAVANGVVAKVAAAFIFIICCVVGCSKLPTASSVATSQPSKLEQYAKQKPAQEGVIGNGYARVFGQQQGAAATVNPLATKAAIEAFAKGGNAIDAALAAAFTLGVVDSHNSGIGGGCFALVRLKNGEVLALDGREMAPAKAHRDMYKIDGVVQQHLSKSGALASGIPGSVAVYEALQKRAGRLTFADVLNPAADLAEQGSIIDVTQALRLQRTAETLAQFPASAAIFLDENSPKQAGDTLVQKDLANTYRSLAEHGAKWFYKGEFARKTEQWMRQNGGIITAEDFANYQIKYREPVVSEFNGFTVYGFPPPSSGGAHVAQILNILAQFNLPEYSEADQYHLVAEAMRRAFADRAYWLGDADFVDVPKGIVNEDYARKLAKDIALNRAADQVTHNTPLDASENLFNKHTTHIATADAEGNWVAITTTLNTSFGSKVVVPGTGVLLNNQMDDFAAEPGVPNAFGLVGAEANSIAPGKRPLSSMSPTIVMKDGQPVLTLGAAGGPTIISQVVQVLLWYLAFDETLEQAMVHPRVHHQWLPNVIFAEPGVNVEIRNQLTNKGHHIKDLGSFGGTQAISWNGVEFNPITEPRVIERNNIEGNNKTAP